MGSSGGRKYPRTLEQNGKEIFDVKPVVLGGNPTDPANKVLLDRRQHIEAVRYWNRIIQNLRKSQTSGS